MPINDLVKTHYPEYLHLLKKLVSINTVYFNQAGVKEALTFCKNYLENLLPDYRFYFDEENNLIGLSQKIDVTKNILYLSAHMDTVVAEPNDWTPPYHPWQPYEDEQEMVGRGVSDCKAGIVAQLLFGRLMAEYFKNSHNVIFTMSSHEENAGGSAKAIAKHLGKKLPFGPKNYLLTLENNVEISPLENNGSNQTQIRLYYGEKSGLGILVKEPLQTIQKFLKTDENPWNPTSIKPVGDEEKNISWTTYEQAGGHSCTVPQSTNIVYDWLLADHIETRLIKAGSPQAISVVPKLVSVAETKETDTLHEIIFDLRTTRDPIQVFAELDAHKFPYKIVKKNDWGYDIFDHLKKDRLYEVVERAKDPELAPVFELCPGSTDTGCIWHFMDLPLKNRFYPLTIGPGTGSQSEKNPPRLTHGVNETFDKKSGLAALKYIARIINEMGFLK